MHIIIYDCIEGEWGDGMFGPTSLWDCGKPCLGVLLFCKLGRHNQFKRLCRSEAEHVSGARRK